MILEIVNPRFPKFPHVIDGSEISRMWRDDIEVIVYFKGGDEQHFQSSQGFNLEEVSRLVRAELMSRVPTNIGTGEP